MYKTVAGWELWPRVQALVFENSVTIFRADAEQVVLWLTIEILKKDSCVVLVLQIKNVSEICDLSSQDMKVEVLLPGFCLMNISSLCEKFIWSEFCTYGYQNFLFSKHWCRRLSGLTPQYFYIWKDPKPGFSAKVQF